ncbi:dentin sialophosphoprotein isoform X2 [Prunus dulcis]|uniref:dentin sialophosphoprotein isoform X2 n=1 Tax=Prunus dulcis TaxID=3755 RepID=UPI0014821461|nr:dentin sialophosphoprotein isoform X2 [Prunus dulcis]
MAPELTTKVRLVRCPKCRQLLPELPEFQVYKCGGCGTTLQAKSQINGMRSMSCSSNEPMATQRIGLDHVSGDRESNSSSRSATLSDSGECSSDHNNERDQSKSLERNESSSDSDKPTFPNSGECVSDRNNEKNEDKYSEDKESSSSSRNVTLPDSEECSSEENNESDQRKSSEGDESSSESDKPTFPNSGEFVSDRNNEKNEDKYSEDKESSSSSHNVTLPDSEECSSEQNNESDKRKSSEGDESSSESSPKATFPDLGECFPDQNKEKSTDTSSEGKESSSSSHNASLSDSGECSSDQSNERDQSISSESNKSSSSSPKANFPDSGECFLDQNNEKSEDKSSENKEPSSSSHNACLSDSGECSSDQNNERNQSKSSEGNESSSSSPKANFPESGESFSDQKNERDQRKSSEGNVFGRLSPKATFPDSGECFSEQNNEKSEDKSSEDKEFGSSSHNAVLPDTGEWTSNPTNGRYPDTSSENCDHKQLGDANLPNEEHNNQSDLNDSRDFDSEQHQLEVSNEICSSTEHAHNEVKESLPITRAGSAVSMNDESLALSEKNAEIGINKEIDSAVRSSSTVNPEATRGSSSIITAHMPARESVSSDSLRSSPNEQLEEPQSHVPNGFDHVRSPDTFENTEFNPSSEFSGAPRDMSKSPAHRSHHAYDGSVSSYDGRDDQFFNRNIRSNFFRSEERPRRDKFLAKNMMNRDSGFQPQARDSWSSFSDKNNHAMKNRKWDDDELMQPRRQGHPSREWNRLQTDEYMSRVPFPRRLSQGGYAKGGPTTQFHDEYQPNSGYLSSDKSVGAEQDKMTLLRMVYELQDQVNNLNGKASGRVTGGATWKENRIPRIPRHCSYEASQEELFHDQNYQRYLRRHRAGSHYPPQHRKFMHVPYSSEATTSRHQVDPSCLHRGPQDWQCSAPLPLPVRCNSNGLCRVHPDHSCWTSYDKSSASSPERYVEPDLPLWGHETRSDDLRHTRHDVNKFFREKHHLAKRHFRPIAECYSPSTQ